MTIKNRYPIPLVTEIMDRISKAKEFSRVDVRDAFNRMRVAEGDEWKMAFRTRYGHFEYLVMPFGLCNTPATFQSYINNALHDFLDDFCVAYLDDVLIYTDGTHEEHVQHVRQVLQRLLDHGYMQNSRSVNSMSEKLDSSALSYLRNAFLLLSIGQYPNHGMTSESSSALLTSTDAL